MRQTPLDFAQGEKENKYYLIRFKDEEFRIK